MSTLYRAEQHPRLQRVAARAHVGVAGLEAQLDRLNLDVGLHLEAATRR